MVVQAGQPHVGTLLFDERNAGDGHGTDQEHQLHLRRVPHRGALRHEQGADRNPAHEDAAPHALFADNVAQTTATLRLSDANIAWWHKRTSPAGTACTSVAKGTSTNAVSGLTASTSYTYTAYRTACSAAGEIDDIDFVTLPAAPAKPTVTAGTGEVTLSWTPDSTGGAVIDKWQYAYKTTGTYGAWTDVPGSGASTTSFTVPDLASGTAHVFKVRAHNGTSGGGAGAASPESDSVTPLAVTLTASSVEAATATLTIANHTGSWYYQYTAPTGGTCSGEQTGTTADLTGLSGNTSYTFKAYSDVSCGTEVATATAFLTKPAKPAKPSAAAGAGSGKLTLTATLTGGAGALTKWQYKKKEGAGNFDASWNDISDTDNSLSHVVTGLKDDTNYQFKVRARNATGAGAESDASDAVQPKAATLTASSVEAATATLTIANHTGSWYYQYTAPTGGTCSGEQTGTTADLTGLSGNTSYTFKAYSDVSCGTEVATATAFLTKPAKPSAAAGAGSGKLTLTATLTGGAGALTKWQYQQKEGNGNFSGWNDISDTDNSLSHVVTGLKNDTNYQFKVRARNATGDGDASDASDAVQPKAATLTASSVEAATATLTVAQHTGSWYYQYTSPTGGTCSGEQTGTTADLTGLSGNTSYTFKAYSDVSCGTEVATATAFLTKPAKPAKPSAAAGAGSGKLTLTATLTGGAGALTKWQYKKKEGAGNFDASWNDISDTDNSLSHVVTGLKDDTNYQFKVRARNATGDGAESDASDAVQPKAFGIALSVSTVSLSEGGGTETYTVRLASQPSAGVTVTITSAKEAAVTVNPASLSFTTTNWDDPQTVTLTPVSDADNQDESVTISHSASGGGYNGVTADLTANVTDSRGGSGSDAAITLSASTVSLTENGSTGTYTARLARPPTDDVTVTVTSGDPGAVTVSPDTLTFTNANYDDPQRVTLTPVDDDDGRDESVTISHQTSGGPTVNLTVNVTDDDPDDDADGAITLSASTTTLTEGAGAQSYTVHLAAQPSADVTVAVSSGDPDAVTVSPDTLTFTNANYDNPQTVTLTPVDDDDGRDEAVTISHRATGGGYDGLDAELTADVTDDDRGIVLSAATVGLTEGAGTQSYTVRLAAEPAADVTVTVSSDQPGAVTVSPNTLIFTAANYDTPQTVVLTPVDDDDGRDEAVTISHRATGGGYDGLDAELTANVADDDRGVALSASTVGLTEGAGAQSYTVRLAAEPAADVAVAVSSADPEAVTASPDTLTFTAANYDTPQTVTLTPVDDDDGRDEAVTISHRATGGGYDGLDAELTANVADDDRGVALSASTVGLTEGGSAQSYTVRLAAEPDADVAVAVSSADPGAVTASPDTLTFTAANYDTPQTVTLTPVDDDDGRHEAVTISHRADGGGYGGLTVNLTVDVTDDEDAGIALSASTATLTEGGSVQSYTVRLSAEPSADVTVAVSSADPGAVTVSPDTLTFTAANYDTPQTVTLAPVDDGDGRDESVTISHRADGGGYGGLTVNLTADVTDDDRGIVLSAATVGMTEGGSAQRYTVRLAAEPSADLTVAVSSADPGAVTASPGTLTFTTANYDNPQTVTLTPVDDDDGRNESVTVSHHADGGGYGGLGAELTADVTDDDRGIVLSTSTVSLTESGSGSTQRYTVRLSAAPAADVTVAVSSADPGAVTVSPDTLTFGPSDWNVARTVTLTAVQDDDAGNESAIVTHTPSGDGYGGEQRAALTVRVTDDDDRGLTLSADAVEVHEGASASYTVRLSARPTAAVTVALTGSGDADLTFETEARGAGGGSALSFTPDDWSRPRTVTLTAAQDDDGVDGEYVVRHTASGGGYDGVSAALTAVERDDDRVGLSFAPAALSLREGDSAAYSVRLATRPAAEVSVALSADDPTLTMNPATLRFAAGTWPAERSVTVTAATGGGADRTAAVTHTASGGEYAGLRGTVTVSVIADLRPDFPADARVPDQSYTQHREIAPLTLPEASGGDGALTYALTPAPPPGLSFDPATRTLSGTPTAAAAAAAYTYTATDADAGDPDSDSLTFTIAVAEAAGADVLEDVLAAQGRAMLTSVTGVLGERFRAPARASGASGGGSGGGRAAGVLARAASMLATAAGPGAYAAAAVGLPSAAGAFRAAAPAAGPAGTIRLGGPGGGVDGLGGGVEGLGGGALGGGLVPPGTIGLGGGMGGLGGGMGGLGGGLGGLGGGAGLGGGTLGGSALGGGTLGGGAGLGGGALGTSALGGGTLGGVAGLGGGALGGGIGPLSGGAGSMTAGYDPGGHAPQSDQRPDWSGLLWGQSFAEPLGAADAPPRWTVWGAADLQHYQGAPAGGRHDGALRSLYVGADARVGDRLLAGAAISPSWGKADYTTAGGRAAGRLETAQTSVYPYLRWTGSGGLEAWALGGFGRGAAEHRPDLATAMVESSDTSMSMAAAGLRRGLAGWRGLDLAVVGSAGFLSLSTAGALAGATGLEAGVQQARMALEAAFAGGPLSPFVQVGGRYDGGDGQTGAGLELVGGVRHAGPRLDLEARGRWLTAHSAGEWREYGAMARLAFHPRADGTGLQLSLAPTWGLPDGGSMTGAAALMSGSATPGLPGAGLPTAADRALSLVNEVGYGLRLTGLPGLVTPTVAHERGFGRVITRAGLSHRPAEGAFGGKPLTMQLAVGRERSAYGGGSYIFLLTLQNIF